MASKQSSVDYILDQIARAGDVSAKKMFGEYGIYCGEKMVALVCDDQLYVKPTARGKALAGDCAEAPPYPGAKNCLLIPDQNWDDRDFLSELIRTTAKELPAARPKKAKSQSAKSRRKVS
jgi:TfoX/Sxy family transcriptional regulator of competence genes